MYIYLYICIKVFSFFPTIQHKSKYNKINNLSIAYPHPLIVLKDIIIVP